MSGLGFELFEVFDGGHHGASAEAGAVVVAEAEGLLAVFVAEELDGGLPVGPEDADFLDDLALAPGKFEGSWQLAIHGQGPLGRAHALEDLHDLVFQGCGGVYVGAGEGFSCLGGLVAEGGEGGDYLIEVGAGGDGDIAPLPFHLALQLQDEAAGGLLAEAVDPGEGGDVVGTDGAGEVSGGHGGEDGEGESRAHAGDADEHDEEVPLLQGGEAVEGQHLFPYVEVGVEADGLADGAEGANGGGRGEDFEAEGADVYGEGVVGDGFEVASETGDHGVIPVRFRL